MIHTILFDLDGTLLDSAKDLHECLEKVLKAHGKASVSLDKIQHHLNAGAVGFLKMGFGEDLDPKKLEALREEFLIHYERLIFEGQSHFFPHTLEMLKALEEKNLRWGIVTNKREKFTLPILENLGILKNAAAVICNDHVKKGKPDPEPLLLACQNIGISPTETCYVGDSLPDMQAAQASAMPGLLALWGYWPRLKYPFQDWPYQHLLHEPKELLYYLNSLINP